MQNNFPYNVMQLREQVKIENDTDSTDKITHFFWSVLAGFAFKEHAESLLEQMRAQWPDTRFELWDTAEQKQNPDKIQ